MRAWIALILVAPVLMAATWNVPQDAPTIQAAFDSLSDGDTVRVAAGVYHESLQAPGDLFFVMLGSTDPNGDPPKPIIDPSPLEGSTHLACLRLPFHSRAVIRNVIFRNTLDMFPREHSYDVGGLITQADSLVLQECVFDSTYQGISVGFGKLAVMSCQFENNFSYCLYDLAASDRTVVRNCSFTGSGDRLAWFTDSALVEYSSFYKPEWGANWIKLSGDGITLRGCTFSPPPNDSIPPLPTHSIVRMEDARGCTVENNLFQNLNISGAAVQLFSAGGDTTRLQRNQLKNCVQANVWQQSGPGLYVQGPNVVVSENMFDSCMAVFADGFRAIRLDNTNAICRNNRFLEFGPLAPVIRVSASSSCLVHDNYFFDTGWAVDVTDQNVLNAEHNWWGDATGPFHAELNPNGLGDSTSGPVDFDPWLTDSVLSAPAPPAPMPLTTQLDVFPNPFNASATLILAVPEPGDFYVDLYNLLGQHIQKIWSGPVAHEQQITFDGAQLTSGLYFVRVYQPIGNRVMALQKVVVMK